MILYGDGTHYVSTCYEVIVMRVHFMMVHFMTVHIAVKHLIIYGQRKVKCKASATITVRSLCFFHLSSTGQLPPPLAASIPLMSAQAGSWHGMPHFPIQPNQRGKEFNGFPHQGVKSFCALQACYREFLLLVRHIYTNRLFTSD